MLVVIFLILLFSGFSGCTKNERPSIPLISSEYQAAFNSAVMESAHQSTTAMLKGNCSFIKELQPPIEAFSLKLKEQPKTRAIDVLELFENAIYGLDSALSELLKGCEQGEDNG